jgi:hypothetical protein
VTELNGHQIFGAFKAGARKLREAQRELNRINVFPVPDGDTGTNMAVTITKAVEGTSVSDSISATMGSMADAAIAGARGNSGVILAQFLAGFRESLADSASMSMEKFVRAIEHAYQSSRRAITAPSEGTILSVIREWSLALRREHSRVGSFRELFRAAAPSLRSSLAATTGQLDALRRAGVVDAGASGFVAFIDGAHEYLESGAPPPDLLPLDEAEGAVSRVEADVENVDGDFTFRYCSEFLVAAPEGGGLDPEAIRDGLRGLGDSLIVAGTKTKARVHIHTDEPARVMERLSFQGWILEQKVDDMRRQYQDAHERLSPVAIVTDSCCDLPAELCDLHGVHVVPLYLRFGDREYLDRLTLDPGVFYDMADAAPVFPVSSQPSTLAFERLYRGLLARYERVVSIHMAAKLSGTWETARRAAEAVDPERVSVVDTRQVSGSLGLVVLRAAEWLEASSPGGRAGETENGGAGKLADGLVAAIEEWSRKAEILVSLRTLRFMVRGGRVSPLGGALAKALNLKPIVSLDEAGASRLYGAAFSVRGNLRRIASMIEARHRRAPLRAWAVVHAHAPAEARALALRLEARLGMPAAYITEISAVVGMNAGRGALAVVAISE